MTGIIHEIIDYYEKNAPLPKRLTAEDVANATLFLSSPLASAITGTLLYVDNGFHAMGKAI